MCACSSDINASAAARSRISDYVWGILAKALIYFGIRFGQCSRDTVFTLARVVGITVTYGNFGKFIEI